MKSISFFFVVSLGLLINLAFAQTKSDVLTYYNFEEHFIISETDTIFFYINDLDSPSDKLVLYLQGSDPDPLFSIEQTDGKNYTYLWFPKDYKFLDESYSYVVIGKTKISTFLDTNQAYEDYHVLNSLDYRVYQADTVLKYISDNIHPNLNSMIVYGHSEGAPVAAKLATKNNAITHLGFWGSNVLPDFYDFALEIRKEAIKGNMSDSAAEVMINNTIEDLKGIAKKPSENYGVGKYDYTNQRWWSYSEPPLYNLLKLDIPIFAQFATKDENAPVESSYILPLEFIRNGKSNLSFNMCVDCDHGFNKIISTSKDSESQWSQIFQQFIDWTEQ